MSIKSRIRTLEKTSRFKMPVVLLNPSKKQVEEARKEGGQIIVMNFSKGPKPR